MFVVSSRLGEGSEPWEHQLKAQGSKKFLGALKVVEQGGEGGAANARVAG